MKKQKGGMFIDGNPKDAFDHFMNNATATYLTSGASGVIFTATINPGITSKYTHIGITDFGRPVTALILKFAYIKPDEFKNDDMFVDIKNVDGLLRDYMNTASKSEFETEINIQTDITLKTMKYLQPLTPVIVYSNIYNMQEQSLSPVTMCMLDRSNKETQRIMNSLLLGVSPELKKKNSSHQLGIIAMESVPNCELLYTSFKSNSEAYKTYLFYEALYIVLKLALDTGYTQGDFHKGNILFDSKDDTYFDGQYPGRPGRPYIIDFGYARKIPPAIMSSIKMYNEKGQYMEALKRICTVERSDGVEVDEFPSFYGYICGTYNDDTGARASAHPYDTDVNIAMLNEARERMIDKNILRMDELHNADSKYPLLPLSNSAMNSIFPGMIGGRQKTKRRKTKRRKYSRKYK